MRVLVDATIPMRPESGSFRYLAQLTRGLDVAADGDEVVVLATHTSRTLLAEQTGHFARVRFEQVAEQPTIRARGKLTASVADGLHVDVVHSPAFFLPAATRARRVVTVHDLNFAFRIQDWVTAGRTLRAARLMGHLVRMGRTADGIVVPSWTTHRQLQRVGRSLAQRAHVIPEAAFAPGAGPVQPFGRREPTVLAVGVISPLKNLELALDAFRVGLPHMPPGSRFVIVGAEEGTYWRRRLAPLVRSAGLEGVVVYEGRVSDARLRDLYRTARVLVSLSRAEGFGLPAVEAQAHGLPVVASASLAEATRGAAVIVDDDVTSVARTLAMVMRDEQTWTAVSSRGASVAQGRTWVDVARDHLDAYAASLRRPVSGGVARGLSA